MKHEDDWLKPKKHDKFTKIGVKNFRIFKDYVEFDINPLTIFTGPNNSGKSTLNKLITMLTSCFKIIGSDEFGQSIKNLEFIQLNNYALKKIGDFKKNTNSKSNSNVFDFSFSFIEENDFIEKKILLSYKISETDNSKAQLIKIELFFNDSKVLHLYADDIENHFNTDLLMKPIITELYGKVYRLLTTVKDHHSSPGTLWVTKYDKSFIEILRNILLSYKNSGYIYNNKSASSINFNFLKNAFDGLLIQSYFSEKILDDTLFFSKNKNTIPNSYYSQYLKDKNISSHKKFIEVYSDFELLLMDQIYKKEFGHINSVTKMNENELEKNYYDWYYRKLSKIAVKKGFASKLRGKPSEEAFNILKGLVQLDKEYYYILTAKNINTIIGIKDNKTQNFENSEIIKLLNGIDNPLTDLFINELETNILTDSYNHFFNNDSFNKFYHLFIDGLLKRSFISLSDRISDSFKAGFLNFNQNHQFPDVFMFEDNKINSQHLISYGKSNLNNNLKSQFVNYWIKNLEIGDELKILPVKLNDKIIGFSYFISNGTEVSLVSNEGLGIQKLISILIFLKQSNNNYFLLIEEPESNLHPSYQSKLAEIFAMIITSRYNAETIPSVIIETHSEYLIRKIQYLISSKDHKLTKEDVSVYYLHNPKQIPEGEKQVYKLDIREDGFMNNDFGKGFFDEASSLSLGLLNLKNFN